MKRLSLKELLLIAQGAVIIAVCSQLTIPLGFVPITGQTFAIGLIATIFPPLLSTTMVAVYLLMGAIGLPVFAGFSGGLGALFSPTGGFLFAFSLNAWITSWLITRYKDTFTWALVANLIGAFVTMIGGTIWLKIAINQTWPAAFTMAFTPFILPGIIKAIAASYIGLKVKHIFYLRFAS